jgi:uncharacterized protein YbjT (DUF2867 family)
VNILLTGATGFVGSALLPRLLKEGHSVRAISRKPHKSAKESSRLSWVQADLLEPETLGHAFDGIDCAYYLVHSIGVEKDYRVRELQSARAFASAAAAAGVKRIIFLGGVAPEKNPSQHLQTRLETGRLLRSGTVPTLELRASMIIGHGSISWQIVRDLALRLPAMLLPSWLRSRTRPVDIDDVVNALMAALQTPLPQSRWLDLPGPEVLSGREILERITHLRGRQVPMVNVPVLTPLLSAAWLKIISRSPYKIARELVLGLTGDLLPRGDDFWSLTGLTPRVSFDESVQKALREEPPPQGFRAAVAALEEQWVHLLGRRLSKNAQ